jgi:hypothetical protein
VIIRDLLVFLPTGRLPIHQSWKEDTVINLYKRVTLWGARVMQHIPGFRRWGRFMERQYTKRFWTTIIINMAIGLFVNYLISAWVRKVLAEINNQPQVHEPDYYEGFVFCMQCWQHHHPEFPPEVCPTYVGV